MPGVRDAGPVINERSADAGDTANPAHVIWPGVSGVGHGGSMQSPRKSVRRSGEPVPRSCPGPGPVPDGPVRSLSSPDPLGLPQEFRARRDRIGDAQAVLPRPRVGFACLWDRNPESTWSRSAWNLRAGLRLTADTVDLGVELPLVSRAVLKAVHTRFHAGQWISPWYYSRLTDSYIGYALRRELARNPA